MPERRVSTCKICGDESVELFLPDGAPVFVGWCADGHVYVVQNDKKDQVKEVFNFDKGITNVR